MVLEDASRDQFFHQFHVQLDISVTEMEIVSQCHFQFKIFQAVLQVHAHVKEQLMNYSLRLVLYKQQLNKLHCLLYLKQSLLVHQIHLYLHHLTQVHQAQVHQTQVNLILTAMSKLKLS
jgi:hypothetical protein